MIKITSDIIEQAEKHCEEFRKVKKQRTMFYELCFVLCSPQVRWESNIKVNKELQGAKFYSEHLTLQRIERLIHSLRYFRNKSLYLQEAKNNWASIYEIVKSDYSPIRKRDWLTKHVNGLGLKTASHFLRNTIGETDLAILDTHLLRYLDFKGYPTPKEYLKLETTLRNRSDKLNISIMVLDAIVFLSGSGASYLR